MLSTDRGDRIYRARSFYQGSGERYLFLMPCSLGFPFDLSVLFLDVVDDLFLPSGGCCMTFTPVWRCYVMRLLYLPIFDLCFSVRGYFALPRDLCISDVGCVVALGRCLPMPVLVDYRALEGFSFDEKSGA